jgi:hypothetical protein
MAKNSCRRRGIGANAVGAFRHRIRQKMSCKLNERDRLVRLIEPL